MGSKDWDVCIIGEHYKVLQILCAFSLYNYRNYGEKGKLKFDSFKNPQSGI